MMRIVRLRITLSKQGFEAGAHVVNRPPCPRPYKGESPRIGDDSAQRDVRRHRHQHRRSGGESVGITSSTEERAKAIVFPRALGVPGLLCLAASPTISTSLVRESLP